MSVPTKIVFVLHIQCIKLLNSCYIFEVIASLNLPTLKEQRYSIDMDSDLVD